MVTLCDEPLRLSAPGLFLLEAALCPASTMTRVPHSRLCLAGRPFQADRIIRALRSLANVKGRRDDDDETLDDDLELDRESDHQDRIEHNDQDGRTHQPSQDGSTPA